MFRYGHEKASFALILPQKLQYFLCACKLYKKDVTKNFEFLVILLLISQLFATKLGGFTNFNVLFQAAVKDFGCLSLIKI